MTEHAIEPVDDARLDGPVDWLACWQALDAAAERLERAQGGVRRVLRAIEAARTKDTR